MVLGATYSFMFLRRGGTFKAITWIYAPLELLIPRFSVVVVTVYQQIPLQSDSIQADSLPYSHSFYGLKLKTQTC